MRERNVYGGSRYHGLMNLTIDLGREDDGRCIAEVMELPGVMCYGQNRDEANRRC